MKNTNINLKAINNTSVSQPISLFGVVPNQNSANNANSMYSFDMSSVVYNGIDSAIITYTSIYSVTPTTIKVTVLTQSIAGVVEALNTLNIGLFNFFGTTIYVSSNTYSYSNLIVGLPFVSTWDTSLVNGGSNDNQITLPLDPDGSYNFFVDWGDGTNDIITSWNQAETTHTYSSIGIYTISIYGECKGIYFNDGGEKLKILSVTTWGDFELIGSRGAQFFGCSNLDLTFVSDVLNFGNCTSCEEMFYEYSYPTINNIELWDVSNITEMSFMFFNASSFNQNIGAWNVSNVTNMSFMFRGAISFNQNIGGWNVSNVTNMSAMFYTATSFNQNIGGWNVTNVGNMSVMFRGATSFNQPLNWDTSNVGSMSEMFRDASLFNQPLNWDTSSVIFMDSMFNGATLFNQPLNWDTSNVINMSSMFRFATNFNQPLNWDTSNVINMTGLFRSAFLFNQPLVWNVGNVTNMNSMFQSAFAFDQNIGSWNISNVSVFDNFMVDKTPATFSATNLDAIYNGWSLVSVRPNVIIDFGTAKYTLAGQAGKDVLTNLPNDWTITDGGI